MRLFRPFLLLILVFVCHVCQSQRANYWYFGANAGLNFNTNPPTPLSNGLTNNPDNTSTISDLNGSLLFYTDGMQVWNKNHAVMPNGFGLVSHPSAGQCVLIIPIPFHLTKYVIFQVSEFSSPGTLFYTVVDMSLNGGLGDVDVNQKNISLGSGWTEKLCAYYNSSIGKTWLLTHKWNSADFVAFEISQNSIASNSVVSTIGSSHSCGLYSSPHDAMGQLTISRDGQKVVNALTCSDKYELFDFNPLTGVLSNSIQLNGNGGNAWGTAFSPDSKKLYVNGIFSSTVYQYDLTLYNLTSILLSQTAVLTTTSSGYTFGYMELGPDNKIYIARPNQNHLTVINSPNTMGIGCTILMNGQSLALKNSTHGLSRIVYNMDRESGEPTNIPSSGLATEQIKFHPNPVNDFLNIESESLEGKSLSITILNAVGDVIRKMEIVSSSGKEKIVFENDVKCPIGFYFLTISSEKLVYNFKLVKQ